MFANVKFPLRIKFKMEEQTGIFTNGMDTQIKD